MKKHIFKFNDKVAIIFVYAIAGILCASGTISAKRGNWVDFISQLGAAFFIMIAAHNARICYKLDERFDRLEELLGKNCKNNEEEKTSSPSQKLYPEPKRDKGCI
jgi:uncharacterized membrane protein required for colicin V production